VLLLFCFVLFCFDYLGVVVLLLLLLLLLLPCCCPILLQQLNTMAQHVMEKIWKNMEK